MGNQCFTYYDLDTGRKSASIEFVFPDWEGSKEKVVVFSPHDDDAILGAGYLMQAALANQAEVYVFIFCDGRAGYSHPEQKEKIVALRRAETEAAYQTIGVAAERIVRLDYPDFSALGHIGWQLINGREGSFAITLRKLRELGATRLVLPNGYREHIDHEAVFKIGAYDGPQVGDPILADWGLPQIIKSFLVYAVWGDFSPEAALLRGKSPDVRANMAIKANQVVTDRIDAALHQWNSQLQIIAGILKAREARKCQDGSIEGYLRFDPRPSLDYRPYVSKIDVIDKAATNANEEKLK